MRYIVYGAGAIGGVVGARLAERGFDVALIARGEHLSAIQRSGLTLQSPLGSITQKIPAVGHPSQIAFRPADDFVLLATKTQDSAPALDALRDAAGPNLSILCLQNGVASARIALRRFPAVYGAMTMLPSVHLHPGIVQAFSSPVPGIVDVGRYPSGTDPLIERVSGDLCRAGFSSVVRPDVLRWQYGKLLDNLKNALQALCGPDAPYDDLVSELRVEAERCYRAAGISCASASEIRDRHRAAVTPSKIDGRERPGDSSWQSLARETGSIESDFLNGEITLLGRLHGVPTPVNDLLQATAARFAHERRPPARLGVDELRSLLRANASDRERGDRREPL